MRHLVVSCVGVAALSGCGRPLEGYYAFQHRDTYVTDADNVEVTESCWDGLALPSGAWVRDVAADAYQLVLLDVCAFDYEEAYNDGEHIPCTRDGDQFTCSRLEESEECWGLSDTGQILDTGRFDTGDPVQPTDVSRGAVFVGEWTGRRTFQGWWSSWEIDYEGGSELCSDNGNAPEEWVNVFYFEARLVEQ